jgi:hypothetical protein
MLEPTNDPQMTERVASIIEWAAKAAIGLATLKVSLSGIYKPFATWRREHTARTVRDVLAPELSSLQQIITQEESCATRMEEVLEQTRMIFREFDDVLEVMMDNRERIDETNELLNEVGFSSERRVNDERRAEVQAMVDKLHERRKLRRRGWLHND